MLASIKRVLITLLVLLTNRAYQFPPAMVVVFFWISVRFGL